MEAVVYLKLDLTGYDYAIAFTLFTIPDLILLALFLWITLRLASLSIIDITLSRPSWAVVLSVLAKRVRIALRVVLP